MDNRGEGRIIREQRTYKVRIPAGIRDGQEVRLRELGGPGQHGGAPGDMYVTVHVGD
ncbi:DnaJ C-terminal domain-containing protein [Streptomyces sp. NPDC086993]|uniref:DnaJ C-terminal domain-containing protein n=1 Tax=unclassified Streptomyces TaxID=2593676 RepID=UPI0038174990